MMMSTNDQLIPDIIIIIGCISHSGLLDD